jgi:hypothetical protein
MAGAAKGFAAQDHGASALWDWDRTLERIHEAPLCRYVRRLDARRAQRRRFSTRKTPRPLKKGRCARPAGLRRGQEGHGPQAPHRCRHDWSPARRERSARRHSRSRAILLQQARRRFPLPMPDSRVENGHDDRRHGMLDDRDRQALPISIVSWPCRTDRSSRGPSPGSAAIDN